MTLLCYRIQYCDTWMSSDATILLVRRISVRPHSSSSPTNSQRQYATQCDVRMYEVRRNITAWKNVISEGSQAKQPSRPKPMAVIPWQQQWRVTADFIIIIYGDCVVVWLDYTSSIQGDREGLNRSAMLGNGRLFSSLLVSSGYRWMAWSRDENDEMSPYCSFSSV